MKTFKWLKKKKKKNLTPRQTKKRLTEYNFFSFFPFIWGELWPCYYRLCVIHPLSFSFLKHHIHKHRALLHSQLTSQSSHTPLPSWAHRTLFSDLTMEEWLWLYQESAQRWRRSRSQSFKSTSSACPYRYLCKTMFFEIFQTSPQKP